MNLTAIDLPLVEDNIDEANLTIRALKKKPLLNNIHHVKEGAEALDFIYSQGMYSGRKWEGNLKLILPGFKMPKVNGIEVLKKIKSAERIKNFPIVVLTSSKVDPDIRTCYELGVNSYIVKPVEFDIF